MKISWFIFAEEQIIRENPFVQFFFVDFEIILISIWKNQEKAMNLKENGLKIIFKKKWLRYGYYDQIRERNIDRLNEWKKKQITVQYAIKIGNY